MRHLRDSFALAGIRPMKGRWLDLGSGAGLPGIPLAILGNPHLNMALVEADTRKCEFLRTVRREIVSPFEVIEARIECVEPLDADVIVSRALAPLPALLDYASPHLARDGECLFSKGKGWHLEVEAAHSQWKFDLRTYRSPTDSQAAILRISALEPLSR